MPTIKKLQRTWQQEFDGKQDKPVEYPALMGRASDSALEVANRPGYIYVRIGNDETLAQARWSGPTRYDLLCVCGYVRKVFRVLRLDQDDYVTAGSEPIPEVEVHADTHLWFDPDDTTTPNRASDPTFVTWRQIMELRVGKHTSGNFTIRIEQGIVEDSRTMTWVVTQTVDLTSSIPASGARWVLIYLLPDGTIGTSDGAIVPKSALTVADIPVPTVFHYRLAAVMLWLGQTQIRDDGGRSDILDLRFPQGFNHDAVNYLGFDTAPTGVPSAEGVVSWNPTDKTIDIQTGLGPIFQTVLEDATKVFNNTGGTLLDGKVVAPVGGISAQGIPHVEYVSADLDSVARLESIVILTQDIDPGEWGFATLRGRVRGIDTSGVAPGLVWLSPTVAGDLVDTKPAFPNYVFQIGGVLISDPTNGVLIVSRRGDTEGTVQNFWNGVFRETFDFLVTENGGVITGTLTPANSHDNMTMMFSDGFSILDTDPGATIVLTPGSATVPQMNFIYIPQSTKVLTLSTSDWPVGTEHIKVATVALLTAALTGAEGALRNQNWNDHIQSTITNEGHLAHIGEKLRQFEAQWNSGAEGTITGTTANVYVQTTAGVVYQMHRQIFEAQSMPTDDIHVVNDPVTPYRTTTNLNDITDDADGDTLNNRWFSIVIWGVQNKTGETSHLMCNLPTGSYTSEANAVSDALGYTVYNIPSTFKGVGFLIGRFTIRKSGATFTYNVGVGYQDLRGFVPNTTAGSGAGSSGVTTFTGLSDTPSAYTGEALKILQVNVGETALEFTDSPTLARLLINETVSKSADTMLQVHGGNVVPSGWQNVILLTTDAFAIDKGAGIGMGGKYNSAGAETFFAGIAGRKESAVDGNTAGYLQLTTRPNAAAIQEVARITSAGDFGINDTAPSRRLQVVDDSVSAGVVIPIARLESQVSGGAGAAGHGPGLDLYGESSTTENQPIGQIAATWETPTHASRRGQLRFFADLQGTLHPVGVIVAPNTAPGAIPAVNAWGPGAVDFQTFRNIATEVASGIGATISGGTKNTASGQEATVGGGRFCQATGDWSTVTGGGDVGLAVPNLASGDYSTVCGGESNTASGDHSWSAGQLATASHASSYVWSSAAATVSWGVDTWTARTHGGARFYSAAGVGTGVQLSSGGNAWAAISARAAKENFRPVEVVLAKVAALPIYNYNLKSQPETVRHIGPVAEEFNQIFGFTEAEGYINSMDVSGIALAAIKALLARVEKLEMEVLQ